MTQQLLDSEEIVSELDISHLVIEDDTPVDNFQSEVQQRFLVEPLYSSGNVPMQPKTHAVVIDGSLAELLVGRSLADHFDRVTIVERDVYPDQPAPRQGVPHSRFPHSLMLRGQQILEQFFPGWCYTSNDAL